MASSTGSAMVGASRVQRAILGVVSSGARKLSFRSSKQARVVPDEGVGTDLSLSSLRRATGSTSSGNWPGSMHAGQASTCEPACGAVASAHSSRDERWAFTCEPAREPGRAKTSQSQASTCEPACGAAASANSSRDERRAFTCEPARESGRAKTSQSQASTCEPARGAAARIAPSCESTYLSAAPSPDEHIACPDDTSVVACPDDISYHFSSEGAASCVDVTEEGFDETSNPAASPDEHIACPGDTSGVACPDDISYGFLSSEDAASCVDVTEEGFDETW